MTTPTSKSRLYARFIPSEEVGDVTQWQFGAVDGSDAVVEEPVEEDPAALEMAEAARQAELQQAREEAFAQGEAQGHAQATLEWQQRMDDYVAGQGQEAAQRLDALVRTLNASLGDLQQNMAQGVLELACEIARQVVRQELRSNPHALKPVVQEALGMLVTDGRPATVRLNPEDHALVGAALQQEVAAASLQWVADATVPPGGCLVEQAGTVVDGSLEKRWERAIAPLGLASAWQENEHGDGA
ncbi:FliH/SctL family protein [Simplicispira lacusdiani]|uniref:FliH/SctL family protein n=1 Tax=Simplicispira lacusdiani TaxID=2213010 RepID=UPI000E728AAF|nr:FliH/SctL family protein [Simplicispira lacusdiani]